jgi:hypothetical protein
MTPTKKIVPLVLMLLLCAADFARTEPATQSISITGPSSWTPGTTLTLNVNLTFNGYNALGLSYWLELPAAMAPFITITNAQYFTFTDPNNAFGFPITFTDTAGARAGYRDTNRDLGATTNPGTGIVPGTYPITTLTFSIAAGAPIQSFTMFTTSLAPRISAVTDSQFGDNNIIPPGQFVVAIIPEPSTLALLALAGLGGVLLGCRHRLQKP